MCRGVGGDGGGEHGLRHQEVLFLSLEMVMGPHAPQPSCLWGGKLPGHCLLRIRSKTSSMVPGDGRYLINRHASWLSGAWCQRLVIFNKLKNLGITKKAKLHLTLFLGL